MTISYIGFARDHSGSMSNIAKAAARDYNATTTSVRDASIATNQRTIVSVVELGYGNTSDVRHVVKRDEIASLKPILESEYSARGHGTPLWDAVGALIEDFESVPEYNDPTVAFLVMVTTDGGENASRRWNERTIRAKMEELQKTDRWTFVFRCPRSDVSILRRQGIPEGNILPWDQTSKGVEVAAAATSAAIGDYMTSRSLGVTSTKKFYANLADVTTADVKAVLTDISREVKLIPVAPHEDEVAIRTFVENHLGGDKMLKGGAFYPLTKTEPKVQDYKLIAIRDKTSGAVYAGPAARQMLGLPTYGDVRLAPDNLGQFEVYIQSTSVNRKVAAGTTLLYWAGVGTAFKEGVSAQ